MRSVQLLHAEILVDLFLSLLKGFLLKAESFFPCSLLEVHVAELIVFIAHELTLIPFLKLLCVEKSLVTLQALLELADGLNFELILAKLKVD